ncbi:MAG: dihydroneopterin aldolase [Schwartzia sp. (in: firmicutes)]
MAKIRVHNMLFYGFHGIYEYEREQGQKFFVDVECETRDNKAAMTDKPEDGVDGALIYNATRDIVENSRSMLLQTVATHVNEAVLKVFPYLAKVTTVIRKSSVPVQGVIDFVEVEVTTENDN